MEQEESGITSGLDYYLCAFSCKKRRDEFLVKKRGTSTTVIGDIGTWVYRVRCDYYSSPSSTKKIKCYISKLTKIALSVRRVSPPLNKIIANPGVHH
jgi:hypothetical protein